jgi:DNA-directed RNA polymerase subunit L
MVLGMEVEVIKSTKDEIEVKVDNVTVAEILRVYLNEQGVDFAAWRRDHPSKHVLLRVKSSGKATKKAVSSAIAAIKKDCDLIVKDIRRS